MYSVFVQHVVEAGRSGIVEVVVDRMYEMRVVDDVAPTPESVRNYNYLYTIGLLHLKEYGGGDDRKI